MGYAARRIAGRDVGAPLVGAQGGHQGRPFVGYFNADSKVRDLWPRKQLRGF